MTRHSIPALRERARLAVERAQGPDAPPPGEPPDPALLARLEAALRSLPRRQREIFLAVRFDAMSYAEIAHRTGLSSERVKREFARALLQLHRASDGSRPEPWFRRWWRRCLRR